MDRCKICYFNVLDEKENDICSDCKKTQRHKIKKQRTRSKKYKPFTTILKGSKVIINLHEWLLKLKNIDYRCEICKKRFFESVLTIDHKKSLCDGGDNSLSNIQAICIECHATKDNWYPKNLKTKNMFGH